jgi:uncharacterized protein
MLKILLLAIIVWLLFQIIKRYSRSLQSRNAAKKRTEEAVMVQCRHCGLHVPKEDSVTSQGQYFCSEEHREQSAPDA